MGEWRKELPKKSGFYWVTMSFRSQITMVYVDRPLKLLGQRPAVTIEFFGTEQIRHGSDWMLEIDSFWSEAVGEPVKDGGDGLLAESGSSPPTKEPPPKQVPEAARANSEAASPAPCEPDRQASSSAPSSSPATT